MHKNCSTRPPLNPTKNGLPGLFYTKTEEFIDQASSTQELKKNCPTRPPVNQKRRIALEGLLFPPRKAPPEGTSEAPCHGVLEA